MVQLVLKSVNSGSVCGFSGSEGGLDGLSLLRSFGRHRVLRSLTQRAFKGGGALVCSMPPCG
jgi:hypothetical protein